GSAGVFVFVPERLEGGNIIVDGLFVPPAPIVCDGSQVISVVVERLELDQVGRDRRRGGVIREPQQDVHGGPQRRRVTATGLGIGDVRVRRFPPGACLIQRDAEGLHRFLIAALPAQLLEGPPDRV